MTPPGIVLCGTAEGRIFDDQKTNITNETDVISPAMLGATLGDMERCVKSVSGREPFPAFSITQLSPSTKVCIRKALFHW